MPDQIEGVRESFVTPIAERVGRIERGLNGLAKVVGLELVDIELGGTLDEATKEELLKLGSRLLSIYHTSASLMHDIAYVAGVSADATIEPLSVPAFSQSSLDFSKSNGQSLAQPGSTRLEQLSAITPHKQSSRRSGRRRKAEDPNQTNLDPAAAKTEVEPASDFYAKIAGPDTFPVMEIRNGEPIEVIVLSDNQLMIRDKTVGLKGHDLFIFNALMTLRDEPRTASEVKALGFDPNVSKAPFSLHVNSLTTLLNRSAGVELIKKYGQKRATRYYVNPNLVLTDTREKSADATASMSETVKKN